MEKPKEEWSNLTHQMRDKLVEEIQSVGVSLEGKWLSEAAIEAIQKLKERWNV